MVDDHRSLQECWGEDASSRPGFEHVIVSIRGLLEGATNKQKMQKTLTGALLACASRDIHHYLSGFSQTLHDSSACELTQPVLRWLAASLKHDRGVGHGIDHTQSQRGPDTISP